MANFVPAAPTVAWCSDLGRDATSVSNHIRLFGCFHPTGRKEETQMGVASVWPLSLLLCIRPKGFGGKLLVSVSVFLLNKVILNSQINNNTEMIILNNSLSQSGALPVKRKQRCASWRRSDKSIAVPSPKATKMLVSCIEVANLTNFSVYWPLVHLFSRQP